MNEAIEQRADFSQIRYGQVWEDADVLLDGLDVQPGDRCLSIASAGDNVLALLTRDPSHVLAVDLSPAQLACLGLRIAAYRALSHPELLELMGSRPGTDRWALYLKCRDAGLSKQDTDFWNNRREVIENGIGGSGRFERYFSIFRRRALPLVHRRRTVRALLEPRSAQEREAFYTTKWDSLAWRLLFRVFFSRQIMGRLGRDPEFFRYVDGPVGPRILARAKHAMTALDPAENPYMQWILLGTHAGALPVALRPEHFDTIRDRLDRVELRRASIQDALADAAPRSINRFNLSDLFEYLPMEMSETILEYCANAGAQGGRLLYWNMLAPRSRPDRLADRLKPLDELAQRLHLQDKAFFYQRLVVEEIL